jgi:hypothetical protein
MSDKTQDTQNLTGAPQQTRRPGFRQDGTPYPGVDMATGERKAVTYAGLMEEFGDSQGVALYNAIAVAAFGGVPPDRRPLDLVSLREESAREGLSEAQRLKRAERRKRVELLLANAKAK